MIDPGVYYGMADAEYHAAEALSASGGRKIRQSPQHYKLARDTPSEPTADMQFGTVVHAHVLEPETVRDVMAIGPIVNKRTKEGKAEWEAFEAASVGKIVLTLEDASRAYRCAQAVRAHPAASRILAGAQTEVSLFWEDGYYKVPCKARLDIYNKGIVADLKTTKDASPDAFGRSAATYEYHAQGAHYWNGAEHVMNASPEAFVFIAVESQEPFAVAVYYLPPVALAAGGRLMDEAMARYKAALAAGKWEGYPEKISPLELPRWALRNDWR